VITQDCISDIIGDGIDMRTQFRPISKGQIELALSDPECLKRFFFGVSKVL
jgi:hypothetical protein